MLKTIRTNFDRHESRRDRRYPLAPITVTLAAGAFATGNWSLGGFLLPPELDCALGTIVTGQLSLPEDGMAHAFTAEAVRCDSDGIGFRFIDPSDDMVGALDRAIAGRLFRRRA